VRRVVRRLAALEGEGRLGSEQVQLAADGLNVSERTVWRWVRQARAGEGLDRRPRERFQVTDEIRQRVAFWRGNTAAVHRELAAAAKAGGPPAPVPRANRLARKHGGGRRGALPR
jgi:putative transposase